MPEKPNQQCPTCQTDLVGPFCHRCGEKSFSQKDLSTRTIGQHVFASLTDIDGKFLKSFTLLFAQPGQLTVDYLTGRRKNRLTPFQILLFVNIVYFLVVGILGHSPFTTKLNTHMNSTNFFHQELAERMVQDHVAENDLTLADYEQRFNQYVDIHAKTLVVLFVPYFTLVFLLLNGWQRKPGVTHLVMATHFTIYMLVVLMVLAPALSWLLRWFSQMGWWTLQGGAQEAVYSAIIFCVIGAYFYLVSDKVFGGSRTLQAIKALLVSLSVYLGFLLYRMVLFFVGFYSI